MNAIQIHTTEEHYGYMLYASSKTRYPRSLGHVASYLGMTREILNRILRNGS